MIEWKKYDPENPPKLYVNYLICTPNVIISARLDKNPYFDNLLWITDHASVNIDRVTHYAEINMPEIYS